MSGTEQFSSLSSNDFFDPGGSAFGPESVEFVGAIGQDNIADLKKKYSGILIQLDHLRPELLTVDTEFRPDGEWSIREIIGHLIDSDREIWGPRINALLNQDTPHFSDVDQDALIRKNNWQALPVQDILAQLMRVRWSNAVRLNQVAIDDFERRGEHNELGSLTLGRILQILVAHDSHYLGKIREMVTAQRSERTISS